MEAENKGNRDNVRETTPGKSPSKAMEVECQKRDNGEIPSTKRSKKWRSLESSENQGEEKVEERVEEKVHEKVQEKQPEKKSKKKAVPTKPKPVETQPELPPLQVIPNSQPVLFKTLTQVYQYVGSIKGQNSKQLQKDRIKSLFTQLCKRNTEDLIKAYWLSVCKIAPDYEKQELGVGNHILTKAIAVSTGRSQKQIRDAFQSIGDLGEAAANAKSSQKTMDSYFKVKKEAPPLTIDKVFATLISIRDAKGNNSSAEKQNKIMDLLRNSKNEETKFIVRFIEGNLKINAGEKTMQTALIEALFEMYFKNGTQEEFKKYSAHIKKAVSEYPNEAEVIRKLVEIKEDIHLLQEFFKITPNIPCKPMLAKPTKEISSILDRFEGKEFTCEFKYDGLRGQIHYFDGKISIFSRNLENMTEAYPDITSEIEKTMKDSTITNFIIDSEIVAINPHTKQLLPFQTLSTRSKKAVKLNEIQVAIRVFTFDILQLNNTALTHHSLKKRREFLKELQCLLPPIVTLITSKQCANIAEIDEFLTLSIKEGTEGLMIKDLGTIYSCAKRSWDWVKLKKDYINGLGDTLDVVPIGGDFGTGKRTGLYGAYLLAVYNSDLEVYETICKIGTGFSDEVLEAAHNFFKDKTVAHCPKEYRVSSDSVVDVWFTPSTVWEVKGADFQLSPIYTCGKGNVDDLRGIGLRFPRLLRIRDDKKPHQCSDISFVVDLYKQQAVVQNKTKNNDEEEDDYY